MRCYIMCCFVNNEGASSVPDVQIQIPVDGYPVVGPRGELSLRAPQMALPYPVK
jgi:hypothetical protein